jgi:hypothetical protein
MTLAYNYWKCSVSRRKNAKIRPWIVRVIETDAIVIRCCTWQKAVRRAIRFQEVRNRKQVLAILFKRKRKHWKV